MLHVRSSLVPLAAMCVGFFCYFGVGCLVIVVVGIKHGHLIIKFSLCMWAPGP